MENYYTEKPSPGRRRSHCARHCCGCLLAVVVVVAVLVTLCFTVFRVRNPDVKMVAATIDSMKFNSAAAAPTFDMVVTSELSIRNLNALAYTYGNSSVVAYYRGIRVGEGTVPAGVSPAKTTRQVNITVEARGGSELLQNPQFMKDFADGAVPVSSFSELHGWVKVGRLLKPKVNLDINCSMTLNLLDQKIKVGKCSSKIKFHRL